MANWADWIFVAITVFIGLSARRLPALGEAIGRRLHSRSHRSPAPEFRSGGKHADPSLSGDKGISDSGQADES